MTLDHGEVMICCEAILGKYHHYELVSLFIINKYISYLTYVAS